MFELLIGRAAKWLLSWITVFLTTGMVLWIFVYGWLKNPSNRLSFAILVAVLSWALMRHIDKKGREMELEANEFWKERCSPWNSYPDRELELQSYHPVLIRVIDIVCFIGTLWLSVAVYSKI